MNAIPSWGADPVRVGCVGSEAVQNDPVICSRACLIDHAGIVRSLHPILDSTASVPRGHPRQPGRRWRSGNGLIVVGLGEDRLGVDVHEPARQVVLRRKLGKQGRALYPVRLPGSPPILRSRPSMPRSPSHSGLAGVCPFVSAADCGVTRKTWGIISQSKQINLKSGWEGAVVP